MRDKLYLVCIIAVIGAAAVFGLIKRQTYTDLLGSGDFMEQVAVAELPEQIAVEQCADLKTRLPEAPVILRVEAADEMEYFFKAGRQRATVREIYKGTGIEQGRDIYLVFPRWYVRIRGEAYPTVQRGFVNRMKKGGEYLVFLDKQYEGLDGKTVYPLFGSDLLAPMFSCEETQNRVIPIAAGKPTYVPYPSVRENEFFAESETALQAMLDLKREMLDRYLGNNR